MENMRHTLVALVQDKPGVLNRIVSLFRRRGFNIESIAVGPCEEPNLARVTIGVVGSDAEVEQVRKQWEKVIDVVKVYDITSEPSVSRELALIKVKASHATRSDLIQIVDIFRANIIDVAADSLTIEVTGDSDKLDSLCNLLRGFGIKEMARTGLLAMTRGTTGPLRVEE
jgi:acetolactate synthase-1/3 small subunit